VATHAFHNSGLPDGPLDGSLKRRFVSMMSSALTGLPVAVRARRREQPLPPELSRSIWKLRAQCARQRHVARAGGDVSVVKALEFGNVTRKLLCQRTGQHRRAVEPAFGVANRDLPALEIDVFDSQSETFEQAQAGSVKERGHHAVFSR